MVKLEIEVYFYIKFFIIFSFVLFSPSYMLGVLPYVSIVSVDILEVSTF